MTKSTYVGGRFSIDYCVIRLITESYFSPLWMCPTLMFKHHFRRFSLWINDSKGIFVASKDSSFASICLLETVDRFSSLQSPTNSLTDFSGWSLAILISRKSSLRVVMRFLPDPGRLKTPPDSSKRFFVSFMHLHIFSISVGVLLFFKKPTICHFVSSLTILRYVFKIVR